jgi:hypothetical protein
VHCPVDHGPLAPLPHCSIVPVFASPVPHCSILTVPRSSRLCVHRTSIHGPTVYCFPTLLSHCPSSHCPAFQCPLPHCLLSDVLFGLGWPELLSKGNIHSMSGLLRLLEELNLMLSGPVYSCVDLHTSRTLYLSASSIATYNHISTLSNDLTGKQLKVL